MASLAASRARSRFRTSSIVPCASLATDSASWPAVARKRAAWRSAMPRIAATFRSSRVFLLAAASSVTHRHPLFVYDVPSPFEQPVEGNQLVPAVSDLLNVEAPAAKVGVLGAKLVAVDPPGADVRGRGGAFVEADRPVLLIDSG